MNSKQEESRQPSAEELKALTPKQRGAYLAQSMVENLNRNTKDLPEPKPRSPEVQARLKEFHSKIGQELADNLNRNVLAEAAQTGTPLSEAWQKNIQKPGYEEGAKRLEAALAKFNQDNKGKTWDDLADEHEAWVESRMKMTPEELAVEEAEKNLQGLS